MQNTKQLNLSLPNKHPSKARSDRGRPLIALLIILILAGVVGWFWLARDPEARQELSRKVDEVVTAFPEVAGVVDTVKSSVVDMMDGALQQRSSSQPPAHTNSTALPGAPPPLVGNGTSLAGSGAPIIEGDAPHPSGNGTVGVGQTVGIFDANSPDAPQMQGQGGVGNQTASVDAGQLASSILRDSVNGTIGLKSAPAGNATLPANGTGAGPGGVTKAPEGTDPFTGGMILQGGASERGQLNPEGSPPADAGRSDDMVVRVAFIEDLAKWMVGNYFPSAKKRGQLQVSLQEANLRYGVGMRGLYWLGEDLPKGRSEALQYVFTPSMLDALYRLYVDRFMQSMAEAGDAPEGRKPLSPEQRTDMYAQYAKRFRGLSGALQSVAAMPDLLVRGDAMRNAAQQVVDTNARYSELVYEHDVARESGNTARAEALSIRVREAAQVYQQAVVARERVRVDFARSLAKNPAARGLDDETRIYVGQWVERRVRENKDKIQAAQQAAIIFQDLAQRFERAAGVEN